MKLKKLLGKQIDELKKWHETNVDFCTSAMGEMRIALHSEIMNVLQTVNNVYYHHKISSIILPMLEPK